MAFFANIKNFFSLKEKGVLGINSRNLDYIIKNNSRKFYALSDDKVLTKKIAKESGIPVPELYTVIEYQDQLKNLDKILSPYHDFVIKPAQGSGGGGILVIKGKTTHSFIRSSGKVISLNDIKHHINNILGGLYALGGLRDKAIIEKRISNIELFDKLAYQGVPDVRIVIYKGVPVMAMLRLPTHESEGKANLHSGGIGVGLCMKTGKTTHAVVRNVPITHHVDTEAKLTDIQIPFWDKILEMSTKAAHASKLGYLGVDIVLDKEKGPMLLEINVRPGISIQIANKASLKTRLDVVDTQVDTLQTDEQKIVFAKQNFGI